MLPNPGPRPAIATFFGVVSLIWGVCTLGSSLLWVGFFALIGAGSWFAGPVAGVVGSAIGFLAISFLVLASFLSFLLLAAGWYTLKGEPRGVSLHRSWAWSSVVLDVLSLLLSGGLAANGYVGLIYAIAVLHFTTPREIEARWDADPRTAHYGAKPKFSGDPDF